jgi:hypothetical protein
VENHCRTATFAQNQEETMLDKTTLDTVAEAYTAEEKEIFSRARTSATGLRKTFECWVDIGKAVEVARRHADAEGLGTKKRNARYREILDEQKLAWIGAANRRTEVVRLMQVMRQLPAVEKWRATLDPYLAARWSSPQSTWNRCPVFHPDGKTKGPKIQTRPMSVSALLKMPADEIALMLHRRCPAKFYAIMHASQELAESGAATRPTSGWVKDRERAAGASAAAA